MEYKEPREKKNVKLVAALIFAVLFILPLGSVYFLSSGTEYRKASHAELKDHGKVGDFSLNDQNNQPVSPNLLHGRVAVVNFLADDLETAKHQVSRIAKVHQNYNNVDDVVFLSFIKTDSSNNMLDLAQKLGIYDHDQWLLLGIGEPQWTSTAANAFRLPNVETGIALVDTSMTVRRYYDITSNPDMGRLVEQIAIVLPKQKRRGM